MASAYPAGLDTFAINKANATATTTDHPAHHNDLADAVNKIEGELGTDPAGAEATVKARLTAIEAAAGGTYVAVEQPTTAGAFDDAFDDSSIAAAWTHVTTTGTSTPTESDKGVLSVLAGNQSADDVVGLVKTLTGVATGDYIETCLNSVFGANDNYYMAGLYFANGALNSSGVVAAILSSDSGRIQNVGLWHGTLTALPDADVVNYTQVTPGIVGPHFLRLVWVAVNSFRIDHSSDGVSWSALDAAATAKTLTPTHGGLLWGTKGSARFFTSTFHYFRTNV